MEEQIQELESPNATQTTNLTATSTLFWRLFVPLAVMTLLTVSSLVFLFTDEDELYLSYPAIYPRIILPVLLLICSYLLFRTLWRLRRVDASGTHIFVTDYWTSVRYPWSDVVRINTTKRLGRVLMQIHLRAPGRFGQVITFLPGKAARPFVESVDRVVEEMGN
jgi:hypothetical protein